MCTPLFLLIKPGWDVSTLFSQNSPIFSHSDPSSLPLSLSSSVSSHSLLLFLRFWSISQRQTPQSLITCCWWGGFTKGRYRDITFFCQEEWGPNEKWHVYIFFLTLYKQAFTELQGPWRLCLTFPRISSSCSFLPISGLTPLITQHAHSFFVMLITPKPSTISSVSWNSGGGGGGVKKLVEHQRGRHQCEFWNLLLKQQSYCLSLCRPSQASLTLCLIKSTH